MITKIVFRIGLAGICALGLFGDQEPDPTLLLPLGSPETRGKTVTIEPGALVSARTGGVVSFKDAVLEMLDARLIYVGETHDSLPMHRIQARIIQALAEQDRNLAVGMEMFSRDRQIPLNKWSLGILTEEQFIAEAEWYSAWNFNFGYYREIFSMARDFRIPLYALNARRKAIATIRRQGWAALSDPDKLLIPEPDLDHADHRRYIRTVFENMDLPPQMKGAGLDRVFNGLYRAQSAWDEVMAHNAQNAVMASGRRMVVLAGSGHLLYNLGINRRAFEKTRWPFKTVVCVSIPEGQSSLEVSRGLADFIWGIEEEERPAFPAVGLTMENIEGLANPVITQKPAAGVAMEADFQAGDVVLDVDGRGFSGVNQLRMALADIAWGGEASFRILRSGKVLTVPLRFVHFGDDRD